MRVRITISFSPDLGDVGRWPGCKTGQDAADRVRLAFQTLVSVLGLRGLQVDVTAVEDTPR